MYQDEENDDIDEAVFSITDFDAFCDTLRSKVASSFNESYDEDLDQFITLQQVKQLIMAKSLGRTKKGEYLINGHIFDESFDDIRVWMYNVGLAKLAAKDLIDVVWDDEDNEFVFTIKNTNSKPSTKQDER